MHLVLQWTINNSHHSGPTNDAWGGGGVGGTTPVQNDQSKTGLKWPKNNYLAKFEGMVPFF